MAANRCPESCVLLHLEFSPAAVGQQQCPVGHCIVDDGDTHHFAGAKRTSLALFQPAS